MKSKNAKTHNNTEDEPKLKYTIMWWKLKCNNTKNKIKICQHLTGVKCEPIWNKLRSGWSNQMEHERDEMGWEKSKSDRRPKSQRSKKKSKHTWVWAKQVCTWVQRSHPTPLTPLAIALCSETSYSKKTTALRFLIPCKTHSRFHVSKLDKLLAPLDNLSSISMVSKTKQAHHETHG